MTTTTKVNTKVSTREPRIKWNDEAITDLNHVDTVIKSLRYSIFHEYHCSPAILLFKYFFVKYFISCDTDIF